MQYATIGTQPTSIRRNVMPVIGFGHYNLRAPRRLLDRLCRFYTDIVGLTVGERPPFDRAGYWLYAGGQDILHLIEASPDEARATDVATTFDHAAFRCAGRRDFEELLGQNGIAYRVTHVPLTGQVQLMLKDPAGNGVELNFPADEA
jgi:catechol 2,3-dioxygenase-like lactoylglutathione lyase family enzyme